MDTQSRIQHRIRLDMDRILVSDSVPFGKIYESRIQHRIHLDMGRIPDSVPNLKKLVPQTSAMRKFPMFESLAALIFVL